MDAFENPFWDLTTAAAWALTRERDAVRTAANPRKEDALREVIKEFPARWREVNQRLWAESGWPKPNDPIKARIDLLSDTAAVRAELDGLSKVAAVQAELDGLPPIRDVERAERLRHMEAEGKIQLWYVFPINDYFVSLFRAGQIKTWGLAPGDARSREIEPIDWASLELEGGSHRRLFPLRRGDIDAAFREVRVTGEQVLAIFPPLEATPVPMPQRPVPEGHGKKAAAIEWLRCRFPSERPLGPKNPELQRMFEREGGVSMHKNSSEKPSGKLGESEPTRWAVLCCFVHFRAEYCTKNLREVYILRDRMRLELTSHR
jgi:hypothetical protein